MRKILFLALILILGVSLLACANTNKQPVGQNPPEAQDELFIDDAIENEQPTGKNDKPVEAEIADIVEGFGKKLQNISLLSPKDILETSMKENYGEYVSQTLITKWINDTENTPGRMTSSPWPDRIEIQDIKEISKDAFEVEGEIIEITSTEKESSGIAAKRPMTLILKKFDSNWLIDEVTLGDYEEADYK